MKKNLVIALLFLGYLLMAILLITNDVQATNPRLWMYIGADSNGLGFFL